MQKSSSALSSAHYDHSKDQGYSRVIARSGYTLPRMYLVRLRPSGRMRQAEVVNDWDRADKAAMGAGAESLNTKHTDSSRCGQGQLPSRKRRRPQDQIERRVLAGLKTTAGSSHASIIRCLVLWRWRRLRARRAWPLRRSAILAIVPHAPYGVGRPTLSERECPSIMYVLCTCTYCFHGELVAWVCTTTTYCGMPALNRCQFKRRAAASRPHLHLDFRCNAAWRAREEI